MRQVLALLTLLILLATLAVAVTISGTVLGPDGKPVAGASVGYYQYENNSLFQGVSNNAGRFSLDLGKLTSSTTHLYGTLAAYKAGFAPGCADPQMNEPVIHLARPVVLRGRVVDTANQPLAGISITLIYENIAEQHLPLNYWKDAFTTRTDAKGGWAIPALVPGGTVMVMLDDPRYEHLYITKTVGTAVVPPMVAETAGMVTGRCRKPDGQPFKGVQVEGWVHKGHRTYNTITYCDENGVFKLGSLQDGSALTLAFTDSGKRWIADPITINSLHKAEKRTLGNITFKPGAIIEGEVVDQDSKAPLANIGVICLKPDEVNGYTDADGKFRFCVPAGKCGIRLLSDIPGYTRRWDQVESLTARIGEVTHVTITMSKGLSISGTLVDEAGNPAANAVVVAQAIDQHSLRVVKADATGSFTASGFTPGRVIFTSWYEVTLSRADDDNLEWEPVKAFPITLPTQQPLRIVLHHIILGTLTGKVVDSHDKPLAGVNLTFKEMVSTNHYNDIITVKGTTDIAGKYLIAKLQPGGKLSFSQANAPGYRLARPVEVRMAADGQWNATGVVMACCDGTLSGIIVDEAGKPLNGVVVLAPAAGRQVRTLTGTDGTFQLQKLPEGDIALLALSLTQVGDWQGKTGEKNLRVTLHSPTLIEAHDTELLDALWTSWKTQPGAREAMLTRSATVDPDLALKLAAEKDATLSSDTRVTAALAFAKDNVRLRARALAAQKTTLPKAKQLAAYRASFHDGLTNSGHQFELLNLARKIAALDEKDGSAALVTLKQQYDASPESWAYYLPQLAYAYRRVDPRESRIMLEQNYAELKNTTDSDNNYLFAQSAAAMAALDFDRALVMIQEIAQRDPNAAAIARGEIACYALMNEQQRLVDYLKYRL